MTEDNGNILGLDLDFDCRLRSGENGEENPLYLKLGTKIRRKRARHVIGS